MVIGDVEGDVIDMWLVECDCVVVEVVFVCFIGDIV